MRDISRRFTYRLLQESFTFRLASSSQLRHLHKRREKGENPVERVDIMKTHYRTILINVTKPGRSNHHEINLSALL